MVRPYLLSWALIHITYTRNHPDFYSGLDIYLIIIVPIDPNYECVGRSADYF